MCNIKANAPKIDVECTGVGIWHSPRKLLAIFGSRVHILLCAPRFVPVLFFCVFIRLFLFHTKCAFSLNAVT